ncbi:hypothetical protein [Embleya sp. NBC_00896]|uniref:hypothetical protein n=1 Tax=Embleya sp. NBC_00896 TaxID=2975961 RepID=UPI002F915C71|nr:hypothetical protein OG928_42595 [Embleya sp. NBC_00896]
MGIVSEGIGYVAGEMRDASIAGEGAEDRVLGPIFVADACSTNMLAHGSRLWLLEDRLVYIDMPWASKRGMRNVLASQANALAGSAARRQRRARDDFRLGSAYRFTEREWVDYLAEQGATRVVEIPWHSIARTRIKNSWSGETLLRLDLRDGSTMTIKWRTGSGADAVLRRVLPFQSA